MLPTFVASYRPRAALWATLASGAGVGMCVYALLARIHEAPISGTCAALATALASFGGRSALRQPSRTRTFGRAMGSYALAGAMVAWTLATLVVVEDGFVLTGFGVGQMVAAWLASLPLGAGLGCLLGIPFAAFTAKVREAQDRGTQDADRRAKRLAGAVLVLVGAFAWALGSRLEGAACGMTGLLGISVVQWQLAVVERWRARARAGAVPGLRVRAWEPADQSRSLPVVGEGGEVLEWSAPAEGTYRSAPTTPVAWI